MPGNFAASNPLSVIIPTYNRSGFVRECLTSLRGSGVADLEIIVSDDGSTDDTRDVVAATNSSAVYLWQPNSGTPAPVRNAGFKRSRGRYVGFLDCDDKWLPGAPAHAVEFLDRHPEVHGVFADARMGNEKEGYSSWIDFAGRAEFFALPHQEVEPGFRILERRAFFRRMAEINPVFLGSTIIRREVFEATGGFDTSLSGTADWELWLRIADRYTWAYMAEPMAVYTRHLGNMTNNVDYMYSEFVKALRSILVKCQLSETDRRWIEQRLVVQLSNHAYLALDRQDLKEARRRYGLAIRAGERKPYVLALAASCYLPVWVRNGLLRVKHNVLGRSQERAEAGGRG